MNVEKNKKNSERKISIICTALLITLAALFICSVLWVKHNYIDGYYTLIDKEIYEYILSIRTDELNSLFLFFTEFGRNNLIIIGTIWMISHIISLKFIKKENIKFCLFNMLYIVIGTLLVCLLAHVLKDMIGRERITLEVLQTEKSKSFPSAHTSVTIYAYALLGDLIIRYINILILKMKDKTKIKFLNVLKYFIFMLLILLALVVAFTRVYLGAHYFTDILGGLLFGLFMLVIHYMTYEKIRDIIIKK